nr:FAD-dependent monooxygenase [Streptomonospora nanhaiensis]
MRRALPQHPHLRRWDSRPRSRPLARPLRPPCHRGRARPRSATRRPGRRLQGGHAVGRVAPHGPAGGGARSSDRGHRHRHGRRPRPRARPHSRGVHRRRRGDRPGRPGAHPPRRHRPHCDYRFGDSLAALREEAGGVRAVFDSGAEHTFDLVVGADGIHSRTRALAFGPEERHVRYLGAHYAIATLPEDGPPLPAPAPAPGGPLVALMRSTPGRTAVYGGTSAMFVFAADPPPAGRADDADRRRLLAAAFANAAEPVADLVERALRADDLFVDSISRVQMPSYTRGRVALLGDAAFGNTLAGFGTGLAVIGACVLAGELAAADGDHTAAFARYGALMRRHAAPARTGNASTFLAPSTAMGLWLRERMFASPRLTRLLLKSTDAFATAGELPDYPRPAPRP